VIVGGESFFFFFAANACSHAISSARAIIFLGLIYDPALWLTLFSPRGSAPGVDRFPDALEARLNQRGTRYHPPRDWW